MIKVLVSGVAGKMGSEVIKAVSSQKDMEVVAGVDPVLDSDIDGIKIYQELESAIQETKPDVVVDFTHPGVVKTNIDICLKSNVRTVVGTTGLSEAELVPLMDQTADQDWAAIIAPNFAIGAILMMRFAKEAANFFSDVEIIEYHHEQKKDSPSGTAIKTAEMINKVMQDKQLKYNDEFEKIEGARGASSGNVHIHSVRLPGYVAHQEVIFGSAGQNLTIKHDSTHRESFMPGVILAIRKIGTLQGVIYGLDQII